jgi:hypothetical protein
MRWAAHMGGTLAACAGQHSCSAYQWHKHELPASDHYAWQHADGAGHAFRIRGELLEREHEQDTRLQMQKKHREGMLKRRKKQGGHDFQIARLDPKARQASRGAQRVQTVRDVSEQLDDDDDDTLDKIAGVRVR